MIDRGGTRVLVIGGSSGIGLATAALAREAGGSVTIAARSKPRLELAASAIGLGVDARTVDILDDLSVQALLDGGASLV